MKLPRPKGPSLKTPQIKPPAFLADLYYDLRDRRLLPLVALVVVAIVAVPFLLGNSEEMFEPPAGAGVIGAIESGQERAARLTVVEAKPGLRDYRKRLSGRTPTDPFKQRYTSSSLKGAELNEKKGGSGGKGQQTSKSTTNGSSGGGAGSAPSPGGAPPSNPAVPPSQVGPKTPGLTFFTYAINVRIVKSSDGKKEDPIVRKRVLPQTPLPGKKAPVVTYMGAGRKGTTNKITGNALLLVSEKVTEIAGDAKCLSGDELCQLLEVEPGFPVALSFGEGVRYTVNVFKLGLVVTGHSKR